MPDLKEVLPALNRIDWNFPGSGTPGSSVHALHPFPGNFIAQIPRTFVEILSVPGDIILDPFGGSGTTAIEALALGRNAISGDYLTVSAFLSRAKIAAYSNPISRIVRSQLLAKLAWDHLCQTDDIGQNGEGGDIELMHWYAPQTLAELRFLWRVIEAFDGDERAILQLIFSDLLYACASTNRSRTVSGKVRRHHWGWIADNVRPKELVTHDALAGFRDRLNNLPSEVAPSRETYVAVVREDARALALESSSVDLIVTSPPYAGMIDYVRANRMLYLWMGWPFDRDRGSEIGARYRRAQIQFVERYLADIGKCSEEFKRVLRPGSYCAVVLGGSRKFPGCVEQALSTFSLNLDLVWGPVTRTSSRRRVSDRFAHQSIEQVVVFQKA